MDEVLKKVMIFIGLTISTSCSNLPVFVSRKHAIRSNIARKYPVKLR